MVSPQDIFGRGKIFLVPPRKLDTPVPRGSLRKKKGGGYLFGSPRKYCADDRPGTPGLVRRWVDSSVPRMSGRRSEREGASFRSPESK